MNMLLSTVLNQLQTIHIKLKMVLANMIQVQLNIQLQLILILTLETVMTQLLLSKPSQSQLPLMLEIFTSNYILEESSQNVEPLLIMLYYQQDMLTKVDLDIGLSKTHGEIHGDKKVMLGQLQEILVLSAIKLVMETLKIEIKIYKFKYDKSNIFYQILSHLYQTLL